MTDHPKPSAEALAAADAICKRHGMLPGGYMRDSLAEDLEAFAERIAGEREALKADVERAREALEGLRDAVDHFSGILIVDTGMPDPNRFALGDRDAVIPAFVGPVETAMHVADEVLRAGSPPVPVATLLGEPITEAERDAISKDGP